MGIDEIVQSLRVELTDNAIGEITDLPIAAYLSWQPTLKTTPLPVNVVRTFELRTIPFNAGLRLDVDGGEHALFWGLFWICDLSLRLFFNLHDERPRA